MADDAKRAPVTPRLLRLLRDVVDTIPVLINVKDRERRYIFVNRYLCDYYGDRPEDVLGRTVEEIGSTGEVEPINDTDHQVLREGRPTGMWELSEVDREGRPRHWVVGKWPLLDPATGEATNVVTMAFDITTLHMAREAGLEHERQIEAITSRAPVMLLKTVLAPDGTNTIPFVTGRMAEDFGLDVEALARDGNSVLDIVHPDDRTMLARSWRDSRERGETNTIEFRVVTARGETRWVSSIATHRREPDGSVISDEVVVDVTELHAVRERAEERELQLASLAQSVPGAIARHITRPDGSATIPFMAGEFVSALGIDLDAVARDASAAWARIHPDDREALAAKWRRSLERMEPFENTARFLASDGSIRWYRSRSVHHRADNGEIVSDTLTIDVTEEKVAERQLLRERELLQSVTANIPGLVFRRIDGPDRAQRYDFIEGSLLASFGVTSAAAMADPGEVWRHFVPEDMVDARAVIDRSLQDLLPYSYTARCRLPETGRILWIEVSATPRALSGGAVVTDGIAVDVTRRVEAEREAQEQRALLQQVIDAVPAAINVKDPDGRLSLANKALADYYGVRPEDLLWSAPTPIEDSDEEDRITRQWDAEVLESGHISEAREFAYVDPEGQTRYWLGRKSPLRNPATGAMDRVVTVSLDITDRVAAEKRAQEAEFRLGSIVENLPGMVLRRIHHPDGSIDYAYAAGRMARELGFTSDGQATVATWDIMLPEDRERMRADLQRMTETMEPLVAFNRYRAPDGSIRWSQNISQPRRLDDGTVISDAILLDVTDRLSAEDRARQRDELLRSVAASIPGAIVRWRVDRQGRIEQEFAAGQFVETGQIAMHPGQNALAAFWPALAPDDGQRLVRELDAAAGRRDAIELDLRTRTGDETRWIKLFGRFRARVAGEAAWDLILLDATESKRYEEQLRIAQKMDAIGNLTGGIAHDFNNILAVIVANLDLLLDGGQLGDEDRQMADAALHAAERGADLTGRLLAFARNRPAEPRTFDGNARIEGIVQLMRRSLGPEIELDLRCGADLPRVTVDPAQFESALMNLVVNARDAMEGRGRIVIETAVTRLDADDQRPPSLEPGAYAMFTVTDFGSGMTPEVQRRAFEPLFTTKGEGRGTGFGLPLVYNFAKQAGGHVTLYSEPGMGTTVRLYLPAHDEGDEALPAPVAPPGAPAPAPGTRILLTDDNGEARHALASQLARHGYVVTEAENAPQALDIAASGAPFDLLITDVIMPGAMNGVELADRLRKERPGLPVLLTSGYPSDALAERRLELGRYELIGKPFRQHELLTAVARLLGEREP